MVSLDNAVLDHFLGNASKKVMPTQDTLYDSSKNIITEYAKIVMITGVPVLVDNNYIDVRLKLTTESGVLLNSSIREHVDDLKEFLGEIDRFCIHNVTKLDDLRQRVVKVTYSKNDTENLLVEVNKHLF